MVIEEWKDVIGYEEIYKVSNKGRILSLKHDPRILKVFPNHRGYWKVNLLKDGTMKQFFVHRLIVAAFIGEIKEGFCVNHKDGNKANNYLGNLEIVTESENAQHSCYELGNRVKAVLMIDKKTGETLREFPSMAKASNEMNIDNASIYRVCTKVRKTAGGYIWRFAK